MNMNVQFQALLKERNFPMQIIEEEEQFVYKGRLTIDQNFIVDFVASLMKGEGDTPGQISNVLLSFYLIKHKVFTLDFILFCR